MSKSLIYMGRVGELHRVALFDSEKPLARRLPVKDVPVLPTNVDYLIRALKRYTENDPVSHLFARNCEYLKKEREKN